MKPKKQQFQKDIVLLTFSMFIIVCLWVGFNIYDTYATSTIDKTLLENIVPINGRFDTASIEKLRARHIIQPDYTSPFASLSAQKRITPTPEVILTLPPAEASIPETVTPIEDSPTQGGTTQ
jgi:hypothetical protein